MSTTPKPSAPKVNLLPVQPLKAKNTKSKPKREYVPAPLTQKIGDFFPAELTMQFQNR